ncbi:DUF3276 family protein [Hymenobacter sp. UV11]|uniref:DUF3276 family protein n=1 Tax=Hymenobacter sp. UV11 TaxID=1849735 RepID=UPI00105B7CA2|nr:DUF3276 family protein [Hymenobacter sp. UV11]TFZ66695.1 DUF3276 family protein [Hymenobacter sp. UV11]
MEDRYSKDQEEIYSHRMKAGKRTYFFDVKATRGQDYYLTITESKRRPGSDPDGPASYEKHKIFLYKEDFNKFIDALHDAVDFVRDELLTEEEVAELDRPRPSFDGEQPRPANPDGPAPDDQANRPAGYDPAPDLGESTY